MMVLRFEVHFTVVASLHARRVQDLVQLDQHHALDAQVLEQMLHERGHGPQLRGDDVNSTVPRLAQVNEEELQQIALIP